nr:HepT-like ribonuclease domain-containing protein [Ardenticatena sp.]
MTPGTIRAKVVRERLLWIADMVAHIRALPLDTPDAFLQTLHAPAAAESYLRRALEALFDLGRHILAKGFARAPQEYKAIADGLHAVGILTEEERALLRMMAGYRNRLTHFYSDVTPEELYRICTEHLDDIERMARHLEMWLREHSAYLDDQF